jgi:DNA-directed RNA polymerase II subunit RPB1
MLFGLKNRSWDSLQMKKDEFDNLFLYELDDENWKPNYLLPVHVYDLKTIIEFRNVLGRGSEARN